MSDDQLLLEESPDAVDLTDKGNDCGAVITPSSSSSSPTPPKSCFPCLEQPNRISFRQGTRFLSSTKQGKVQLSRRRAEREEFVLSPVPGRSNVVLIQSHKFQRYLAVETIEGSDDGPNDAANLPSVLTAVTTIAETESTTDGAETPIQEQERAHWFLQREVDTGNVVITSLMTSQSLICENDSVKMTSPDNLHSSSREVRDTWSVDSVTGELCFLSSNRLDQRLRCDLVGTVSLTDNWKGWEVWRMMESVDGYIRISSWMHSQFLLICREDGTVTTGAHVQSVNDPNCDTEWAVSLTTMGSGNGVTLRSKKYDRLLSVTTEGKLSTIPLVEEEEVLDASTTEAVVWQIEAAHRQRYTFTLKAGEKDVSLGPFPFVTANPRQSDELIVEQRGDDEGVVAFRVYHPDPPKKPPLEDGSIPSSTTSKQEYLCATSEGRIEVREKPEDGSELWAMETAATGGGYTFRSQAFGYYMAYEEGVESSGKLVCSFGETKSAAIFSSDEPTDTAGGSSEIAQEQKEGDSPAPVPPKQFTVWNMNPCMPRAVSSSKIKTFAIGTSVAIGTTVAMPFAMAGVMGVLGAFGAEVGLLANIVTVGLTGAEAIASVGAIGATAAICFRESSDSLSSDANDKDEEDERKKKNKALSQRPFCSWRSWT